MQSRLRKARRLFVPFFLALIVALGFVGDNTRVLAIPDVPFYSGNEILYFDPDDAGCSGEGLVGRNTKEKVWNYLIANGLTPEQSAGVMGNMQAESGINPTRHQGTGDIWNSDFTNNAWGLVQWDGGRRFTSPEGGVLGELRKKQPQLEKYTDVAYDTARNPDADIPAQDFDALLLFELNYMLKESQNRPVTETRYGEAENEWDTLKLTTSVNDATVFWHNNFEVSADSPETVISNRGGMAQDIYDELVDLAALGQSAGCTAFGGIAETVMAYAWPEYSASKVEKKPEYETAVNKAKEEGRYIGDTCHGGGVDCGAFVTLLLQDSGFEPEYNSQKGNTDGQEDWAIANWGDPIGKGSDINTGDLRPGDVAFSPGHTFVFVGNVEGFETQIASASQCSRAPMEGAEDPTASNVTWYRKK